MPLRVALEVVPGWVVERDFPLKRYMKIGRMVARLAHKIAVQISTPDQIARSVESSVYALLTRLCKWKKARVLTTQIGAGEIGNLGCAIYADNAGTVWPASVCDVVQMK